MKQMFLSRCTLMTLIIQLIFQVCNAQVEFTDQSILLGVADTSRSYGLYWGDMNNDGYPDYYSPNHYNSYSPILGQYMLKPHLYINNNGTSFNSDPVSFDSLANDFHGAMFFKFKNDDETDFLVCSGGCCNNLIISSPTSNPSSLSSTCITCQNLGRGRTYSPLDYNNDGLLDVISHHEVPREDEPDFLLSLVYSEDGSGGFDDFSHILPASEVGFIADIDNDSQNELITYGNSPLRIFDYNSNGFNLIYEDPTIYSDCLVRDFDNDGLFETVLSRKSIKENVAQISSTQIEAFIKSISQPKQINFSASGQFYLLVYHVHNGNVIASDFSLYAGSNNVPYNKLDTLFVDQGNANFDGYYTDSIFGSFLHLGFDNVLNKWQIQLQGQEKENMRISIVGDGSVTLDSFSGINQNINQTRPLFLKRFNEISGNVNVVFEDTIGYGNIPCMTSADYDNDGDLDIAIANYNVLQYESPAIYINEGQLNFTLDPDITSGTGDYNFGHSDAITSIDFDLDGNIDLGTVNGWIIAPVPGTTGLFKNMGNSNHWVKISLNGIISNKMGVGSKVKVFHDNNVQTRVVDGGIHWHAQEGWELHFGLNGSQIIDSLIVEWPSGISTTKHNLVADSLYYISETSPEDLDGDGVLNVNDNCPEYFNPNQILPNFYLDGDGDSYGTPSVIYTGCSPPPQFVDNNLDCNDNDNAIYTGAPEICDGLDNDCDGVIDNLCDECVASNFISAPEGLFHVQTATKTQLKWNHYSDATKGCLISSQRIDGFGNNIGSKINFAILGSGKVGGDANGHDKSGQYTANQEFIKFNQNTFPNGNTASWVPGAYYKWRVRCACVIDNSIPNPEKVQNPNLHFSPWSEWSYFTNLNISPLNDDNNNSINKLSVVDITIRPNPSSGIYLISLVSDINSMYNLSVNDILGKSILFQQLELVKGLNEYRIDLTPFSDGIYTVQLTGTEVIYSEKIIKE